MILNFFDKFLIDTFKLQEKLNIISESNTENASYISYIFNNAIEYLFNPITLKIDNIQNEPTSLAQNIDVILYFCNANDKSIKQFDYKENVIFIGKHENSKVNNKLKCININDLKEIKAELSKYKNIAIGFNIESINFNKYYYNKTRSYFLNLANAINQTPIEVLKGNVEETCTKLLLDKNNFNCKCEVSENLIDFKSMIKIYYKLYKIKNILDYFYIANSNLENKEKMLLNELDKIIKVHKMEKEEEKISFIYDDICERMLEEIAKLKYCYFINGKCLKMRYTDGFPNSKENGCCSNTYKSKGKDCKYLKEDYSCSICSISCRLFTCLYLQERGIDHSLWQYPIIDCNIGKFTRVKLVRSFFIPKEKMMRKLHNKIK